MDEAGLKRLKLQIETTQGVTWQKLDDILHHCKDTLQTNDRTLAFYLTRCDADGFREDELVSLTETLSTDPGFAPSTYRTMGVRNPTIPNSDFRFLLTSENSAMLEEMNTVKP